MLPRLVGPALLVLLLATVPLAQPVNASVSAVNSTQICSAWGVDLTVNWESSPDVLQQYVDVTQYDWSPGGFWSQGPLSAVTRSLTLPSLQPQTYYFLRIVQQDWSGAWLATETFPIYTSPCSAATFVIGPVYEAPPAAAVYASFFATSYGSSFSVQPIDQFVARARIASYTPSRTPVLVNAYNLYVPPVCQPEDDTCVVQYFGSVGVSSPSQNTSGGCHPGYSGGTDRATGGCIRIGVGDYDCWPVTNETQPGPNYVINGPVTIIDPADEFELNKGGNPALGCE